MLGARKSKNLINHIGEYTQGKKVLEGEPGWNWLKKYDPNKKYYSAKHLTLYKEDEIDTLFNQPKPIRKTKTGKRLLYLTKKLLKKKKNPIKVYWSYYSTGFCKEKLHGFPIKV